MTKLAVQAVLRPITLALLSAACAWLLLARSTAVQAAGVVTVCDEAHLRAALAGGGSVTFNCAGFPIINVASSIVITANTSIDGAGGVLIGGARPFSVTAGTTLSLSHLILGSTFVDGDGGCLYAGGTVSLNDVELTQCEVGPGGHGGALYVDYGGSATLANSRVHDNTAGWAGGGVYSLGTLTLTNNTLVAHNVVTPADGGGIWAIGSTRIDGSTIYSNTALNGYGGGIYNQGTLSVTNSVLDSNFAHWDGGGIQTYLGTTALQTVTVSGNHAGFTLGIQSVGRGGGLSNGSGTLTLTAVTLSGNSAGAGGGLFNYFGTANLLNVTLSGNSAQDGGGLHNNYGLATLTHVTLAGNSASRNGGGIWQYFVGSTPTRTLQLMNTIIQSGALGANCYVNVGSEAPIDSEGYNLSSDGTCGLYFDQPGDRNGANLDLGPLANNGGPTLTHMPRTPSDAIDAIPPGANGCGTSITTDQRGAPRPINGKCDSGAVEYGWPYRNVWLPLIKR